MFFAFKVLFEFVISLNEKYNELKYFIDIIDQRKLQEQNSQKSMSKFLAVLFSLLPKQSIDLEILHKEYRFQMSKIYNVKLSTIQQYYIHACVLVNNEQCHKNYD